MELIVGKKSNVRKRRQRELLFIAQQGKCWLCGGGMKLRVKSPATDPLYATFDHVVPRAKGGLGLQDNKILAHKRCNSHRGDNEEVKALR